MSYSNMTMMPAQGSAHAAMAPHLGGDYAPGMAGGRYAQPACAFPQAPPKRCYCQPAAFTSLCGRSHHRLLDAYGSSTVCNH